MTQLDEHGARILAFVEHYQQQHHRSPSYREIGAAVGLKSIDHVARDLRRLKQQGYLSFTPGVSKSIVLLKTPRSRQRPLPLSQVGKLPNDHPRPRESRGAEEWSRIAAGLFEDEQDVFILRARGSAMQDSAIGDGDLVVVERGEHAREGAMIAVWSKAKRQTMLRYFYRENGHLKLQPPDPNAHPEYVKPSEIEIRGAVLAIIRQT